MGSAATQGRNLLLTGVIPPEKLSSGTKTLLLMNFEPTRVFNATNCGDNCAYWILRIASKKDVTINLYHLMDFGGGRFTSFKRFATARLAQSSQLPTARRLVPRLRRSSRLGATRGSSYFFPSPSSG